MTYNAAVCKTLLLLTLMTLALYHAVGNCDKREKQIGLGKDVWY